MKTLLKDMPEHAERIENNFLLVEQIKDELSNRADWSESKQSDVLLSENFTETALDIAKILAVFVNQNYTFKGI